MRALMVIAAVCLAVGGCISETQKKPVSSNTGREINRASANPSTVVSGAPKSPTLANLTQCYRLVAAASYVYPERYDPNSGFIKSNYRNGYCLFLSEDTILSPALLESGKRGFIVYTPKEAQFYKFPETPNHVEETFFRYDLRVRLPNDKISPVVFRVRRVGEIIVNFETGESYEQALERQRKSLENHRVGYGLWLKTEESSSSYMIVEGHKITDPVAIASLLYEIRMRLEDILSRSKEIGLDFRGSEVKFTGDQIADHELMNRDVRLALIGQAIRACRRIMDDNLQRTVDKLQESLGYSD